MTVSVVTDSTASLTPSMLQEYGISMAPLFVVDGGIATPDPEIDESAFYRRLESCKSLPSTTQSSLEDLTGAFRDAAAAGRDAVGIFISEAMSGTVQAARVAARTVCEEFPGANIAVLDSRSNSMQEGFAVLSAAAAAKAGATLEECMAAARETMLRTRYLFTPASLEYLRKGGRIGTASALLGQVLQICPILTVEGGHTATYAKVRTRAKALSTMAEKFTSEVTEFGLKRAVVHYISDRGAAERFAAESIEPIVGSEVPVLPVSPSIGVHVGPAVAVAYETQRPLRESV